MYNFLESYLSNRLEYVVGDDSESKTLEVPCGFPQGSVLGPLLVLLYMNDMNDSINLALAYFLQMTLVLNNSFKPCINMNEDQQCLNKWSEKII